MFRKLIATTLIMTMATGMAVASTRTWNNSSGDGKWSTAANWSDAKLPAPGDHVVFDETSTDACAADDVSNNLGSITMSEHFSSTVTFAANAVQGGMELTVSGNITVNSGNLVFIGDPDAVGGGSAGSPHGIGYTLQAANITIADGASINADDKGFGNFDGPGSYINRNRGPSHGGTGGSSTDDENLMTMPRYGSVAGPTSLGSGGNHPGGGAIKLIASGTVTVNGRLSADATIAPGNNASGAGGSIWVAGGILEGEGIISASSLELGNRGGGGGGRIDISDTTNNFEGTLRAEGAPAGSVRNRVNRGLTGSILVPQSDGTGLTLDNFEPVTDIRLGNSLSISDAVINDGITLYLDANTNDNVFTFHSLTIEGGGTVLCKGNVNAINEPAGGTLGNPYGTGPEIVAETVTVNEDGKLSADGWGHGNGSGPGGESDRTNGGGHYGGMSGYGANYVHTKSTYGTVSNVAALGSGGSGGGGGGAIELVVSGTLTVDGDISANGTQGSANQSSGSGGSVWIDCALLQGSGTISANGGAQTQATGGGGRVHLEFDAKNTINPVDGNNVRADSGVAGTLQYRSAAGTVLIVDRGTSETYGSLLIDNNNVVVYDDAVCTLLPSNDAFTGSPPSLKVDRVIIRNLAILRVSEDRTLAVTSEFSNDAEFVADDDSTVAVTGTGEATISGSNSFENLAIQGGPKTVRFQAATTNNVAKGFYVNNASLYSSIDTVWWHINVDEGAVQEIHSVTVRDSHAGPPGAMLTADTESTDEGNNINWYFEVPPGTLIRIK